MSSKISFEIDISYKQLCIFLHHLTNPFNDWSQKSFNQGFAWRKGSASFKTIYDGAHVINFHVNSTVPALLSGCVRAFRVPFNVFRDDLEIGSISDSKIFEIENGDYILQVEFFSSLDGEKPEINLRLNIGNTDFFILKADDEIFADGELDTNAMPAV